MQKKACKLNEYYQNPYTGTVKSASEWYPYHPKNSELVRVIQNEKGVWIDYHLRENKKWK